MPKNSTPTAQSEQAQGMLSSLEGNRGKLPRPVIGTPPQLPEGLQDDLPSSDDTTLTPEQLARLNARADQGRKVEIAVQAIAARQFECSRLIGQFQAFDHLNKYTGVGKTILLRQMKEGKAYKGVMIPMPDGSSASPATFDEFCTLMGLSRSKVDMDILNLNTFGEEFMESAQKMGLGYRELRSLRAIPEDERKKLVEEGDPETLKDTIADLAVKSGKLEKDLKEARDTLSARDKVLADKNTALDEAKTQIVRLKNIPPDERLLVQAEKEQATLKDLHIKGLRVLGVFTEYLAQATGIRADMDASPYSLGQIDTLTSGLCSRMSAMLRETDIEVDFELICYPPEIDTHPALRGDDGKGA